VGDDVVEFPRDALALLRDRSISRCRDPVGLETRLLRRELARACAVPGGAESPQAVLDAHRAGR
jgi:hypothetical protein